MKTAGVELIRPMGNGSFFSVPPHTLYLESKDPALKTRQGALPGMQGDYHARRDVLDYAGRSLRVPGKHDRFEKKMRDAMEEVIPLGLVAYGTAGGHIYVNQRFCDMLGRRKEELMGDMFPFLYLPPDEIQPRSRVYDALIQGQIPLEGMEMRFQTQKGRCFYAMVYSSPLLDDQENLMGWMVSIQDITQMKMAENRLRELNAKLIHVREAERRQISQDLHDSLGGHFTAVKYRIEHIRLNLKNTSPQLDAALRNLAKMVKKSIEETRRISKRLHPCILDNLGLVPAVESLCEEFKEVFDTIHLEAQVDINEKAIPKTIKILIYRVLQEALNNAAKHSGAGRVGISLIQRADSVHLLVEDNGRGFDPADLSLQDNHGMGMENMRERTEPFDGMFRLHSRKGEGTLLEAIWPLSKSQPLATLAVDDSASHSIV